MKKYNNTTEFANPQSSPRRSGKTFLMKPAYEANSFMCTDFNFEQTVECPRVIRLQDYLSGIEDLTDDELYRLMGNQPVFYLQERFATDRSGYEWNGFLLFRTDDKQQARQLVTDHATDLHIVMGFDSPLDNRYYILINTGTGRFDEKVLRKNRFKYKALLEQHLDKVTWMSIDFFVRAFTEDHYDLVDKDALFGEPETVEAVAEDRCCKTMTVGEVLKSFFSHLFRRSA